jgi:hypothetical protein
MGSGFDHESSWGEGSESLFKRLVGAAHPVFFQYRARVVQHAVPAPPVAQVQADHHGVGKRYCACCYLHLSLHRCLLENREDFPGSSLIVDLSGYGSYIFIYSDGFPNRIFCRSNLQNRLPRH